MASLPEYFDQVALRLSGRRVVPPIPPRRQPIVELVEETPVAPVRDASSAWTAFIRYIDAHGEESERRFTCQRIEGTGSATHVFGFCHEREAVRLLRIDRIVELIDAETGEELDVHGHFEMLREIGALKVRDKMLTEVVRALVFLARCDGQFHPFEADAITQHIASYCIRFNGTDRLAEGALSEYRRLAPDDRDMVTALKRIAKARESNRLAKFVLDCGAAVIDADGRHTEEEIEWAVEISETLKAIADRN